MAATMLNFSTTVPRALVHREALAEVFLTDYQPAGDGLSVAAQLPRTHSYYNDHTSSPALYDPLVIMEVLRQCGILASHALLGAPEDSSMVFDTATLEVLDTAALRVGPRPTHITVDFQPEEVKERGGRASGAVFRASVLLDGAEVLRARLEWRWMTRRTWQALRERARATLDLTPRAHLTGLRLPTYLVGRGTAKNVVLSGAVTEGDLVTGHVVVDREHPGLFDHPLDHISGALMFEAFRQTALYAASEVHGLAPRGLAVTSVATEFLRVGEFELPTDCKARVGALGEDGVLVTMDLVQEEHTIATARLGLERSSCFAASAAGAELVSA
ncbi:AfsA-related hotdog domain-containing protein [Streptomyces sp. NPDC048717]|uniref:AfsA-related hotdog domain-containing protein n=1 Tax=unclassified Streptomyces TaxID=2593676 RepID=UPI0034390BF9